MRPALFRDRAGAGRALGQAVREALGKLPGQADPVILALPRGGVPIGAEVARICGAPLDLLMVRKLGMPGHAELAVGAVVDGDDPQMVVNPEVLRMAGMTREELVPIRDRELAEIDRRRQIYLPGRPPIPLEGRDAIVVDDGIATGATVRAALKGLGQRRARRIVLAVPVAPADTVEELRTRVGLLICLETPSPFWSVGAHYQVFDQVSDEEVVACLREHS
ncbi:phosphoribosyltransferase [Aliiruegeria sabulilitoris]|uniref:phosphoribosyltransferase n=1 Tax=Aliiruegeria sabulilitoris TaxID=1510458 RepID=UPI0008354742|nr:phosphoribosyltransferase family protein [Aliiruegeria sabulilitoris]NDR58726.1 phosphoribosyltransferase [Pseudoruegeria sp. M32A2M]